MSKVKHVMVSESKALCGRAVVQGTGADCKNCARVSDANSKRAAAMVPSGNGLVCICDDVWADTSKVEPGTRVVCPVDGTTFERETAPVEAITPMLTDEAIAANSMDAADIAEYNVQRSADIEAAVMAAQRAITDNGRVFLAEAHNWGGTAVFDALVASGWAYLIKDGDMSRYVSSRETPGNVWTVEQIEARAAAEQPIREAYRAGQSRPMDNPGDMWTADKRAAWNALSEPESTPDQPTPPTIRGYYWARHNGHTSVENGPTVRTTDAYQLVKDGTTCQVAATISHVSGFRWRPSGCVWINTGLSSGWDGVPLADAFARVQTYMAEVAHVRATDPTSHHARMRAGDVARSGLPFISAHEVRLIADTPSEAPMGAVVALDKPTRTKVARRARKALKRKHKASTAHQR